MTLTRSPTAVRILEHIATCAISGRKSLLSLPGSERTIYHKLTQLKSEGYIAKSCYYGETLYVLSQKGRESLTDPSIMGPCTELYAEHLRNRIPRVNPQDPGRTLRQQKQGEIITVMEQAGVRSFVGDKPLLGLNGLSLDTDGHSRKKVLRVFPVNLYYTSTEIRSALGETSRFSSSARIYGLLATRSNVFAVYHTGERALMTSANKEILAVEEFCAILSEHGYSPYRSDTDLVSESSGELSEVPLEPVPEPTGHGKKPRGEQGTNTEPETEISEEFDGDYDGEHPGHPEHPESTNVTAEIDGPLAENAEENLGDADIITRKGRENNRDTTPGKPSEAVSPGEAASEASAAQRSEASAASEANDAQRSEASPSRGESAQRSEADGEADSEAEEETVSEALRAAKRQAAQRRKVLSINYTASSNKDVIYSAELAQDRLAAWLGHYYADSIIFGTGYEAAREMIDRAYDRSALLKPTLGLYRSMNYIPVDEKSAHHLRLITTPNWEKMMERIIFKTKPKRDEEYGSDGIVDGEYWYNFCGLDLIRITKLLQVLHEAEEDGEVPDIVIWAQSHHEPFLRSLFDKYGVQYKFTQIEKLITVVDQISAMKEG